MNQNKTSVEQIMNSKQIMNARHEMNKKTILADFRLANLSRMLSVTGRREVLSGKAKFGIFGDGKELIQIAMAKQFRNGDWRSGYYRDQTWMMAMGLYNSVEFFHQLYGNTDKELNRWEAGEGFSIIIFRFPILIPMAPGVI